MDIFCLLKNPGFVWSGGKVFISCRVCMVGCKVCMVFIHFLLKNPGFTTGWKGWGWF